MRRFEHRLLARGQNAIQPAPETKGQDDPAILRLLEITAQDFRDTAQALFDGRLGPLDWIEERPLSDGGSAFRDLRQHAVSAPKIVLSPWP